MNYLKALVTGSSGGIGKAVGLALAARGFDVAFHYRTSAEAAAAACREAAQLGVSAIALQADVTRLDEAERLVDSAAEELGGLSVIVNNVGDYVEKSALETSVDEWHDMINSNLNATFYTTRTAIPHLRAAGGGRIVNFAFASAQHAIADNVQTAYRVAKSGVIIYSKALAQELIANGITVNVVSPGVAENSVGLDEVVPLLPATYPAPLEDFGSAVGFLVSPEASYITGQVLEVAGGWRL